MKLNDKFIWRDQVFDAELYTKTMKGEQAGAINSLSENGPWNVPGSLIAKIDSTGDFRPFFGDTVVFTLRDESIRKLARVKTLIENNNNCFAKHLDDNQLHLTLHDLSNGNDLSLIKDAMRANQKKSAQIFEKISAFLKKNPEAEKIKMKAISIFPCLNISLLVGYAPASEYDFQLFTALYSLFDEIVPMNFWPRPHVTLNYFKPQAIEPANRKSLLKSITEINLEELNIDLYIRDLNYQHFEHMDFYKNIIAVR